MLKLITEKYEDMYFGGGGGYGRSYSESEKIMESKPKLYKFKGAWYAKGPLGEAFGMTPKTALDKYLDMKNIKQVTANKSTTSDSSWTPPSSSTYDSGYDVATQTAILATCSMF